MVNITKESGQLTDDVVSEMAVTFQKMSPSQIYNKPNGHGVGANKVHANDDRVQHGSSFLC